MQNNKNAVVSYYTINVRRINKKLKKECTYENTVQLKDWDTNYYGSI